MSRGRLGLLAPYRPIPEDSVVLATPASDQPRYTQPRPGKLSPAQIDALVSAVAVGRTLRDVAAEFGISAERVRQLTQTRRVPALADQ